MAGMNHRWGLLRTQISSVNRNLHYHPVSYRIAMLIMRAMLQDITGDFLHMRYNRNQSVKFFYGFSIMFVTLETRFTSLSRDDPIGTIFCLL